MWRLGLSELSEKLSKKKEYYHQKLFKKIHKYKEMLQLDVGGSRRNDENA